MSSRCRVRKYCEVSRRVSETRISKWTTEGYHLCPDQLLDETMVDRIRTSSF
ncbi:hypothetical protein L3Y34_001497 [Caenorhabditis briggsae]|uniref:Uncharacterized protein n=1 Tax=Caenorhabditis briggsae TaxID=6238 RepID=A0AAE9DCF1_CAEBR|nr:hypothetical protein L3Y34_001497 [Caenorhabditis briggsae]